MELVRVQDGPGFIKFLNLFSESLKALEVAKVLKVLKVLHVFEVLKVLKILKVAKVRKVLKVLKVLKIPCHQKSQKIIPGRLQIHPRDSKIV